MIVDHPDSSAAPEPSRGPDQTRRADGSEASSVEAAERGGEGFFFHSLYLLFIVGLT